MMQAVQAANQSMIKWDSKASSLFFFVMFFTIVVLVTHTHTHRKKKDLLNFKQHPLHPRHHSPVMKQAVTHRIDGFIVSLALLLTVERS